MTSLTVVDSMSCWTNSSPYSSDMVMKDNHREFWDEVLFRRILEETPPWERQSLELVCRRIYLLSQQTPYKRIPNLHLFLERVICTDGEPPSFKIFLKAYDSLKNKFEKIKNSTQIFSSDDFQILESYLQKCHTNITKLTINGMLDMNFFKIIGYYLKNVRDMDCKIFNKDLVDGFLTSGKTLTEQIKFLRLSGMDTLENCDFLAPFPNLQNLYMEEDRCCRNLLFSLKNRQSKLELIGLKEDRESEDLEEEWNLYGNHVLDELELYSKKVAFINSRNYSTTPFHYNISLKFENLTCFEVSLQGFHYREVRAILENTCLMRLHKLVLKDVHFNRRTFNFEGSLNSLKELILENWISLDESYVYLKRFLSESIKILKLRQLDLPFNKCGSWGNTTLCPNLEEIEFFPRTFPKIPRELLFFSGNFYNWFGYSKKIKRISSSVSIGICTLRAGLLSHRERLPLNNLELINLVLHGTDISKFEKKLQEFYGEDKNGSEYYIGPKVVNPDFPTFECGTHKVTLTFPPHLRTRRIIENFNDLNPWFCTIPGCGCVLRC